MAYTKQLTLYEGATPNTDLYYRYSTPSSYLSWLDTNYTHYTIDSNSYTVNNGAFRVKMPYNTSAIDMENVTYIAMTVYNPSATNTHDPIFFHVERFEPWGDYVIFFCSVDYWGTYYSRATFSNLLVDRCTRNIGYGLYPDIALSRQVTYIQQTAPTGFTFTPLATGQGTPLYYNKVAVLFAISYVTNSSSGVETSECRLFALPLLDIILMYIRNVSDNPSWAIGDTVPDHVIQSPIEIAASFVGGIYEMEKDGLLWTSTSPARVERAYLLPIDMIGGTSTSPFLAPYDVKCRSKSKCGNYTGVALYNVGYLAQTDTPRNQYYREFTVGQLSGYQFYFGTKNKGVKVPRVTTSVNPCRIVTRLDYESLTVTAECGDVSEDITNEFSLDLSVWQQDAQMLARVNRGVHIVSGGISNAARGGFSPTSMVKAGIGMGVEGIGAGIVDAVTHYQPGSQSNEGDAWSNFNIPGLGILGMNNASHDQLGVQYPIFAIRYGSWRDENAYLSITGAQFGIRVASLTTVFNSGKLSGTSDVSFTVVRVPDLQITGVPIQAQNEMRSSLGRGIRIYDTLL